MRFDNIEVEIVQVTSVAVEIFEATQHTTLASDESMAYQAFAHALVGQVCSQVGIFEGVVLMRCRKLVEVWIPEIEIKTVVSLPYLMQTNNNSIDVHN